MVGNAGIAFRSREDLGTEESGLSGRLEGGETMPATLEGEGVSV